MLRISSKVSPMRLIAGRKVTAPKHAHKLLGKAAYLNTSLNVTAPKLNIERGKLLNHEGRCPTPPTMKN